MMTVQQAQALLDKNTPTILEMAWEYDRKPMIADLYHDMMLDMGLPDDLARSLAKFAATSVVAGTYKVSSDRALRSWLIHHRILEEVRKLHAKSLRAKYKALREARQ